MHFGSHEGWSSRCWLPLLVASLALAPTTANASRGGLQPGDTATDFELTDWRGQEHKLLPSASDSNRPELTVVAFLGVDCPLVRAYGPRLAELAATYGTQSVKFVAINSNRQDSLAEMGAFARSSGIEFALLKDPDNKVADQFGASRTPEVFVLDKDQVVRYRGRIDDQYIVGRQRPKPTQEDLREALDELLAGKSVTQPVTEAVGCFIGRAPQKEVQGNVTYSHQISRLLNSRCVRCHRPGEIAPFTLTSYEDASGWAEAMMEVVDAGRMPPWFANPEHGQFKNDARLTGDEKQLLADWVAGGCPEGDPVELPPPPQFVTGWQIPEPDQVVYIRDEPFDVPATGTVQYKYFTVDPGWTEDKWIKAAECRPDNRAVVHHIVAVFLKPLQRTLSEGRGGMVGYAPGMPPVNYPHRAALYVPAGSKILFQMQYTPNGTPQKDRSYVGLVFADPATVDHKITGGKVALGGSALKIVPHEDNQVFQAQRQLNRELRLVTLTPHMHLRGKSFRYEAIYPDGTQEILLDVPRFDFNWQLRYDLAEPKRLPKGTTLVATARFDNSENNLANPDPSQLVTWGDQTWDEMMIGYFTALPDGPDAHPGTAAVTDDEPNEEE